MDAYIIDLVTLILSANFPNISTDTLSVRMSRTSPGRYALHEFAKNIYNFIMHLTEDLNFKWDLVEEITDETLKAAYDEYVAEYSAIEEASARHILLATPEILFYRG